jgi:hypothetical protein
MIDLPNKKIAILGGGIAGTTAAIYLGRLGWQVTLYEKNSSIVSGPPICHLHAGGNLYREISLKQCEQLLWDSIDTLKLYPFAVNNRPTIIATPITDKGNPADLIERLTHLQALYRDRVNDDVSSEVLGNPELYFKLYSREELDKIKHNTQSLHPKSYDDWLVPFAKHTDLDLLKYPVIAVNEHGLSVFRLAASAILEIEQLPNVNVKLKHVVENLSRSSTGWQVDVVNNIGIVEKEGFDYIVNAAGFRTGEFDNVLKLKRDRFVEFKAAYVTKWQSNKEQWPEVIFHGERGTPQGMAQLTPYADGVFQLHGMTKNITLFEKGLAKSTSDNAYPLLTSDLLGLVEDGWPESLVEDRTTKAIEHIAQFIPSYLSATVESKPLFGAQQIPGFDASLRSANVSFDGVNYARIETVKASSCIQAARKIAENILRECTHLDATDYDFCKVLEVNENIISSFSNQDHAEKIEALATKLTSERGYPTQLANYYGDIELVSKESFPA